MVDLRNLQMAMQKGHGVIPSDSHRGTGIKPVQDSFRDVEGAADVSIRDPWEDPCPPSINSHGMVDDRPHKSSVFARSGPHPHVSPPGFVVSWEQSVPFLRDRSRKGLMGMKKVPLGSLTTFL
jgi:hypothetical protein